MGLIDDVNKAGLVPADAEPPVRRPPPRPVFVVFRYGENQEQTALAHEGQPVHFAVMGWHGTRGLCPEWRTSDMFFTRHALAVSCAVCRAGLPAYYKNEHDTAEALMIEAAERVGAAALVLMWLGVGEKKSEPGT